MIRVMCLWGFIAAMLVCWRPSAAPSHAHQDDCPDIRKKLLTAEKTLNDWPNLGRYKAANERLGAPVKNENRVVFLGDSLTDSWDAPGFGGFFPGKPYVNRGISGQTTPQMLIRFHADVVELKPKVVVILAGTNDIAGNTGPTTLEAIENNLASMWELARTHGIRVVTASLLPVSDYVTNRAGEPIKQTTRRPPDEILKLNAWIKYNAPKHGHIYLDYFSALADQKGFLKQELSYDGLHVNARGYAVMTPLAERAIGHALKGRR